MVGMADGLTERKELVMESASSIAYLAGLFDGEGSVMYKQYIEKRKNRPNPMKCWRIRLDVAMTDEATIKHIYDTLDIGWWGPRTVRPGRKPQWRWSTSFRGANKVARMFLPYAKTKKEVLQKIVDHYDKKSSSKRT